MSARQLRRLLAHVDLEIVDQRPAFRTADRNALLGALAVDRALDHKQRVDAAHDLDGDRRERDLALSGSLAASVLLDVGQDKELAPRMRPARRLLDRAGLAVREIELVVAVVGVGLQDARVANEMRLRMLAAPVARVVEHRGRRPGAAERLIVADVDPEPTGVGLAFGQHRNGGVVAVQALGRHDMGLDEAPKRIERRRDRADGVGHGGERDRGALERIALGLPVQRLVLAELLEHDHREQARARPASRDRVERRRRLADLFAVPAGELLPHRLDHLPPPGRRLQRPRHVLAELVQAMAAAARASRRRIDHHPLARQMVGKGVALGAAAGEGAHRRRLRGRLFRRQLVFSGARRQLLKLERQLVDQPHRPFRPLPVDLALELRDLQLLRGDQRHVFRRLRPRDRQLRRDFQAPRALGDKRRFQGGDVFGKGLGSRSHATQGITN